MQVSHAEFKSHLSQYVGQAQSGELIELTSHRKVVARIVGVPPADSAGVARLLAAGAASWQAANRRVRRLNCRRSASRFLRWCWKIAGDSVLRYVCAVEALHCGGWQRGAESACG